MRKRTFVSFFSLSLWERGRGEGLSSLCVFAPPREIVLLFLALLVSTCLCAAAYAQKPAKADTLYLRDGSVLTGIVLRDSAGHYYVYNDKCGKLSVNDNDVLYTGPAERGSDSTTESFILIDESSDAIRVIVKFPDAWKIESALPEPARRFEGLIVWEQPLRRQQRFAPSLTFRLGEGETRRPAAGTDMGEESETDGR